MDFSFFFFTAWETLNDYFVTYIASFSNAVFYAIKIVTAISFLIFIRAGLPRYRYDFLTKLGWSKFLLILLFTLFTTYMLIVCLI